MSETDWLNCADPEKMLAFLGDRTSQRKLRLFVCACCRRNLHLLPGGDGVVVEVAERYADGLAPESHLLSAAWRASHHAIHSLGEELPFEDDAVAQTVGIAERAIGLLWYRASLEPGEQADAVRGAERAIQSWLLRELFGNPFRSLPPMAPSLLSWNDGLVLRLAQSAYDSRLLPSGHLDAACLSILADALEDAGCADGSLLGHLREEGIHVRGCWAVDTTPARK